LTDILTNMPKTSELVFPPTRGGKTARGSITSGYYQARKKLAWKLGNPRLLKIGLHTFRHWEITNYAHKHRDDPYAVQEWAGHRDMATTMGYIHMEKQIYRNSGNDEFTVLTAKTIEEASNLLATGFDFVQEHNGVMIYRKRK
jgi:integrase